MANDPELIILVPAYNEGRNPVRLLEQIRTQVPEARVVFLDDASESDSQRVLEELRMTGQAEVFTAPHRRGKALNLAEQLIDYRESKTPVCLLDCDVSLEDATLTQMLRRIKEADLVVAAAEPLAPTGTGPAERAAIFSAHLQADLRAQLADRYPAFAVIGRCLMLSPRAVAALAATSFPPHTEDAHIAFALLQANLSIRYCPDLRVFFRAPVTLHDFQKQGKRYRDGLELLSATWGKPYVDAVLNPPAALCLQYLFRAMRRDVLGALCYACCLAMSLLQRRFQPVSTDAAWDVADSTKAVHSRLPEQR